MRLHLVCQDAGIPVMLWKFIYTLYKMLLGWWNQEGILECHRCYSKH